MASANIASTLDSLDIHKFLKIYQMNGFTRQMSENSDMWAHFKQYKEMDAMARSIKYLLVDSLGYGAVQAVAQSTGAYPAAQRSALQEPEAFYKEWAWTVSVPRSLEGKTGSELMQYAKPLATELDNKQIAFARLKCIEVQGDGSGSIGIASANPTVSSGKLVVAISGTSANAGRSYIRWFQETDLIKFAAPAGTARLGANAGGNNVSVFKVESVDESAGTVTLSGFTASDSDLTVTARGTVASGDHAYRIGVTPNDLTSIGTDYAKLSEVMVGLESLTAADGRLVNGVTHSGTTQGTRKDLNGAVINNNHFQQVLSALKRKAGKGRYTYDKAFMADETYDALVEARAADRRFMSLSDTDHGVAGIGYVHGKDRVEFVPDEFVNGQRIWILPSGKDALCYIGKEAQQVKPNGNDPFQLAVGANGQHQRETNTYFEQSGVVVTKHARALGVIEDFATE